MEGVVGISPMVGASHRLGIRRTVGRMVGRSRDGGDDGGRSMVVGMVAVVGSMGLPMDPCGVVGSMVGRMVVEAFRGSVDDDGGDGGDGVRNLGMVHMAALHRKKMKKNMNQMILPSSCAICPNVAGPLDVDLGRMVDVGGNGGDGISFRQMISPQTVILTLDHGA